MHVSLVINNCIYFFNTWVCNDYKTSSGVCCIFCILDLNLDLSVEYYNYACNVYEHAESLVRPDLWTYCPVLCSCIVPAASGPPFTLLCADTEPDTEVESDEEYESEGDNSDDSVVQDYDECGTENEESERESSSRDDTSSDSDGQDATRSPQRSRRGR